MALTIDQITAASYPGVLTAMRKPANQWAEHALLREMERLKAVERKAFGPTLEESLDYRMNPDAAFLATDFTAVTIAKTLVLTAASYAVGEIAIPITWTEGDEAKNPSENQKVALVKALLENGINTHDDKVEQAMFSTLSGGFLGFQTLLPDTGQGTPGGIDAVTELFWRHYVGTYKLDGTDIKAALATATNQASKGSGGLAVDLIFTGPAPYAIYEASLQSLQRFIDTKTADASYEKLAYRTAGFVYSQYGGTRIYGINSKSTRLVLSKDANRKLLDRVQLQDKVAWTRKIYSALQLVTRNKSRNFVLTQVP